MFRYLGLLSLAALASGAPVYQQMFGGPGPNTATDTQFVLLGNTTYESFGYEFSFNSTQDARFNALNSSNVFTFSVSSVNTPTWVAGRKYEFTQTYSGDTTRQLGGTVRDTVTGITYTVPTHTAAFGNVANLIVRMVAPDPDLTGNTPRPTAGSLAFTNWVLNGQSIAGMPTTLINATFDDPLVDDFRKINYFAIGGIDFTQAWTLSGEFLMDWSGSTLPGSNANPLPGNNDLAFQIKAYQLPVMETPEPVTSALLGVSLIGLSVWRRRS